MQKNSSPTGVPFASFFLGNDDGEVMEDSEEAKVAEVNKIGHSPRHDTVQFDAVEAICYESEGQVDLMIKRVGHGETKVVLNMKTRNLNIHKAVYVPAEAEVTMDIGEFAKRVSIPVGKHAEWTVEGIMEVSLAVVEGKADLGDLHTIKVYVLNEVLFPSNVKENSTMTVYPLLLPIYFFTLGQCSWTSFGPAFELPADFALVFGFFLVSWESDDLMVGSGSESGVG